MLKNTPILNKPLHSAILMENFFFVSDQSIWLLVNFWSLARGDVFSDNILA